VPFSSSRALFLAGLLAILLIGIAAWLLNVPLIAIVIGIVVSLLALFLSLSRHAAAGKRSGVASDEQKSRPH
jgi:heme A synthase